MGSVRFIFFWPARPGRVCVCSTCLTPTALQHTRSHQKRVSSWHILSIRSTQLLTKQSMMPYASVSPMSLGWVSKGLARRVGRRRTVPLVILSLFPFVSRIVGQRVTATWLMLNVVAREREKTKVKGFPKRRFITVQCVSISINVLYHSAIRLNSIHLPTRVS